MKRHKTLAGILSAGLLVSAGCATQEGRVMNKFYSPAKIITITVNYRGVPIPVPIYIPETKKLRLRKYDGEKIRNTSVPISREAFNGTEIGDWYIKTFNREEFNAIQSLSNSIKYPIGSRIPFNEDDIEKYFPNADNLNTK